MEKQSNALAKSKTPEEKLKSYLDFGKTVMKYYRQIPDEQQLAMDAKVYLSANLTQESLTAAFELYLGLKDSLYPPKPGQLIALVKSHDEQVKPFVGFSDEDRRQAEEAEGSDEKKRFEESLKKIVEGTNFPKNTKEKLRVQAERVGK